MAQYKVIAGAVPAVHDRKIVSMGEVLNEDFFKDGEIGELIRGKFIEEYADGSVEDDLAKKPKK